METQEDLDFIRHECERCTPEIYKWVDVDVVETDAKAGCLFANFALYCIHFIDSTLVNNTKVETVGFNRDGNIEYESTEGYSAGGFGRFAALIAHSEPRSLLRLVSSNYLTLSDHPPRVTTLQSHREMKLLPESTSSDETFKTMNEWLTECVTSHVKCPNSTEEKLESRLRSIRFLLISERSVLLVPDAQPATYAALSHCWGTGFDITKTMKGNIEQHIENGIDLITLPKTFQDAIYICRRLDIKYLWIDSLCIIQDDPRDWADQASRMEDVYKYSFVTIAATKAQDPTQGCFSDVDEVYRGNRLLDFTNIIIRRESTPAANFTLENPDDANWPLCQRAWTFQELILSPRVIHFGMQEVMWACATENHKHQSVPTKLERDRPFYDPLRDFTAEQSMWQWHATVESFSARKLTFHKDRLPAIAAIAKRMQYIRLGDQYLAGLWRSTLLYDILWCVPNPILLPQSSQKDSATWTDAMPSWSWASVPGRVRWPVFGPEYGQLPYKYIPFRCVELLETIYITDGPKVSGRILEASIKLKAPLIKTFLDPEGYPLFQASYERPEWEETRRFRLEFGVEIEVAFCHWDHVDKKNAPKSAYLNGSISKGDTGLNQQERDVLLIPLLKDASTDRATSGLQRTFKPLGLIVESTDKVNMYKRVGMVVFESSRSDIQDSTMRPPARDGVASESVGQEDYVIQEIEGMKTHTIILI